MSSNKLTELFESLNPNEIRKLGEFVQSPFFNKSKRMKRIFYYLKKSVKNNKLNYNKNNFILYVFEKENINDSIVRIALSDFTRLIKKFLIHSKTEKNQTYNIVELIEESRLKGAFKNFIADSLQMRAELDKNNLKNADEYYHFSKLYASMSMYNDNKLKINRSFPYQDTIECIEHSFMLSKLHYHNLYIISKTPLYNETIIPGFLMENILSEIAGNIQLFKEKHKLIYCEYLIMDMLLSKGDYNSYNELLLLIKKNYKYFDNVYLTHLFYTFNTKLINEFKDETDKLHQFKFYKVIEIYYQIGFFDNYQQIPYYMFHNSINISINLGKISFAESFYEKYSGKIEESISRDVIYLPKAMIHIQKKEYETAIKYLSKVKNLNYQIYLNSRIYLARIYYELGHNENLFYLIDSCKHYLSRNKAVIGNRNLRFKNYFRLINQLAKIDEKDKFLLQKLRKEILNTEQLADKTWFLEAIQKKEQ